MVSVAAAAAALALTGDWATVSRANESLILKLHYEMTCGLPGKGPVVARFPRGFRLVHPVSAFVNGRRRPTISGSRSVTVQLPKPPDVTCMSIAPGVLTVALRGVRVPKVLGVYTIRAEIGEHTFAPRLRVR